MNLDQVITIAASKLPLRLAVNIYTVLFGLAGASKFIPNPAFGEMWPSLPSWFWPLAGIWELTQVVLIRVMPEHFECGLNMGYVLLGGVISSGFLKDGRGKSPIMKLSPLFLLPAIATIVLTGVIARHKNFASDNMWQYLFAGVITGLAMSNIGEKGTKADKKA